MSVSSCKALRVLKGFKIVHLNCRSIYNKITQLSLLTENIDLLCLTETWLHDMYTDVMVTIPGKKCFRWDRSNGHCNGVDKVRGGGLACYVDNSIAPDCTLLRSLCITSPHIELLTIKLTQSQHKTRYILTVYRPPCGNVVQFFQILEDFFELHNLIENEVWLVGDFNINYLKRTDVNTKKAIDFAREYGLHQLINSTTHQTGFSASCIDLIFTNAMFIHSSGVLDDVLSDHFPVFACVKKPREVHKCTRIKGRSYIRYDKTSFCSLLQNDDWTEFYNVRDPNILWDILIHKINTHLSVMCPIKFIRVTINKPFWLSHHILESINDRNHLYKKAKNTKTHDDLMKAKLARNRTNKLINSSKEDFIKTSLENNASDPKKFWRIINNSLLKNGNSSESVSLTDEEGVSLSDKASCTYMNDYLTNFGVNLKQQFTGNLPTPTGHYERAILDWNYEILACDLISILKEIDCSKGSGLDFVPSFIIKDAFLSILPQILFLMNQSLLTGIFPSAWSVATVTPFPKNGDLHNVGNWRPISILPLPGKLLEKICTKLLLSELGENEILSKFQFGFRKGMSTSHAIFHYVKHIIDGINKNDITAAIYLDFARAFDSVNYRILDLKLSDMGLSQSLRRWIRGYLSDRRMCTKFNGHVSDTKPLVCGVPQGSVIGPILFLCYINDIVSIAERHDAHISLYADDAVIYVTSRNEDRLALMMQNCINDVILWCKTNQINLNVNKTKLCCYGRRQSLKHVSLDVLLQNRPLNVCHQYNYLGVILDETMNLKANYNNIFKKFSYKIFQFGKIRRFLQTNVRVLVYKQTILPLVEYVNFMLFLNRNIDTSKLQRLQNRALHLCYNINNPRDISVLDLHKTAKLLTLQSRREMHLLNILFDIRGDERYLKVPTVETRQSVKVSFITEVVHMDVYKNSPYYVGSGLWDGLPVELQKMDSKQTFKTNIHGRYLREINNQEP